MWFLYFIRNLKKYTTSEKLNKVFNFIKTSLSFSDLIYYVYKKNKLKLLYIYMQQISYNSDTIKLPVRKHKILLLRQEGLLHCFTKIKISSY